MNFVKDMGGWISLIIADDGIGDFPVCFLSSIGLRREVRLAAAAGSQCREVIFYTQSKI